MIGVVGDAQCDDHVAALAEQVGFELAQRGATVVCGGLGGVMEAACRGAKKGGGTTVGVLPGDNHRAANRYVDVPVATGMGEARNVVVVKTSQAIIAIAGRYGTLSEIALGLKLGIPVIGLNTWELAQQGKPDSGIIVARTPQEAVSLALELARDGGTGR